MKCWKNTCGWNTFCVEGSCPSIGGTKKFWTVSERKPHGYPTLMPPDDAKWSGSWVHWGSYDSLKSWNAWRKWFVGKLILSLPKTKIAPGGAPGCAAPSQKAEISQDLPTNPFLQLPNVSGNSGYSSNPLGWIVGALLPSCSCTFWKIHRRWLKPRSQRKVPGFFFRFVFFFSKKHRWSWAADGYRSFFALFGLSFWSYRTVSPKPCLVSQKTRWWFTIRPCCHCCYYGHRRLKSQVVTSKMRSVWMRSRSFFSCALKWATQRTPSVAWQHNDAGVGGVGGGATVATIPTIHTAPTPLPPQPLPSQFAEKKALGWPTSRVLIFLPVKM